MRDRETGPMLNMPIEPKLGYMISSCGGTVYTAVSKTASHWDCEFESHREHFFKEVIWNDEIF